MVQLLSEIWRTPMKEVIYSEKIFFSSPPSYTDGIVPLLTERQIWLPKLFTSEGGSQI